MGRDASVSAEAEVFAPAHVLAKRVGDEIVLLNLSTEYYFGLDGVGTEMWEALCRARTIAAAHDQLRQMYDVDPDELQRDLADLVEQLLDEGLLEVGDGAAS